jgi:hypothetical protein
LTPPFLPQNIGHQLPDSDALKNDREKKIPAAEAAQNGGVETRQLVLSARRENWRRQKPVVSREGVETGVFR